MYAEPETTEVADNPEVADTHDRIQAMATAYIENPIESEIREQLGFFRIHCRKGISKGRNTKQFLLIGDPGTGKSTLIRQFIDEIPVGSRTVVEDDGQVVTYPVRPVVYVETPSDGTAKSLLEEILEALGEKLKKTRKEQDMLRLIITRFQQQLVEMLFIDEAHHLVERSGGTGKLLQHNARVLKQLLNKSGAGVVLVGIPLARNVLGIDDDQNGRRTEYEFRLGRLDWNDKR